LDQVDPASFATRRATAVARQDKAAASADELRRAALRIYLGAEAKLLVRIVRRPGEPPFIPYTRLT
jgi:hypothetical protein